MGGKPPKAKDVESLKLDFKHKNVITAHQFRVRKQQKKKRRSKEDLVGTKHYEELGDKHLTGKMF